MPDTWVQNKQLLIYHNTTFFNEYIPIIQDDNNCDDNGNSIDIDAISVSTANSGRSECSVRSYKNASDDANIVPTNVKKLPQLQYIYDLDGTLIIPASKCKFSRDHRDWKFVNGVQDHFMKLAERQDYFLCIISNQGGLDGVRKIGDQTVNKQKEFQKKFLAVINRLTNMFRSRGNLLYVFAIFALNTNDVTYRKPYPSSWYFIEKNLPLQDISGNYMYIGDAAGRHSETSATRDHSCCDRKFALNTGMDFKTPEEFFLGYETQPFLWGFDPRMYLIHANMENNTAYIPEQDDYDQMFPIKRRETHIYLSIMVGCPGSGKSAFAEIIKKKCSTYKMKIINQDDMKTQQKMESEIHRSLCEGYSLIIDRMNHLLEDREKWIEYVSQIVNRLGKKLKVYTFEMQTDISLAYHLNIIRSRKNSSDRAKVPQIVYHTYKKRYVEPDISVEKAISKRFLIPFVPQFSNTKKMMNFLIMTESLYK